MGINRTTLEFKNPKTTLKDRVAGRVQHGYKSTYLTFEEEEEPAEYLKTCAKIGIQRGVMMSLALLRCRNWGPEGLEPP